MSDDRVSLASVDDLEHDRAAIRHVSQLLVNRAPYAETRDDVVDAEVVWFVFGAKDGQFSASKDCGIR
jgi:hypothetical protein